MTHFHTAVRDLRTFTEELETFETAEEAQHDYWTLVRTARKGSLLGGGSNIGPYRTEYALFGSYEETNSPRQRIEWTHCDDDTCGETVQGTLF